MMYYFKDIHSNLMVFNKNQKNFSLRYIFCIYITEKPAEYHKCLEIHTVNILLILYKRYTEVHLFGHIFHVSLLILLPTIQFHLLQFFHYKQYKYLETSLEFFSSSSN